ASEAFPPTSAGALRTFGGRPARVRRSATSALTALTSRHPPTVEPGDTGLARPGTLTIASPAGAPVSRTRSATSGSFTPRGWRLWLASQCRRLTIATTFRLRARNPSAISTDTTLQPLEETTRA